MVISGDAPPKQGSPAQLGDRASRFALLGGSEHPHHTAAIPEAQRGRYSLANEDSQSNAIRERIADAALAAWRCRQALAALNCRATTAALKRAAARYEEQVATHAAALDRLTRGSAA